MMHRTIRNAWLWPWLLLLSLCAWAEPAAWRIAAPGTAGEVVLLGSVHVLRAADHPLPERIDALYRAADTLVLELGPEDLDPLRVQSAFVAAALLPPDASLHELLDERVHALTTRRARELGLQPTLIERLKPWMAALTLMDAAQSRHGYRADLGVEQYLLERALADGLEVSGLETLETQIDVFDRLPDDEQHALLEQTLRELDAIGESLDALVEAWREGELEVLAEELLGEFREFPELYEALVTERNAAWIDGLEALLEDGRHHLVAIGALHLVGPGNVIELMEARGWTAVLVD